MDCLIIPSKLFGYRLIGKYTEYYYHNKHNAIKTIDDKNVCEKDKGL